MSKFNRRKFLKAAGLSLVGLTVASCAPKAATPVAEAPEATKAPAQEEPAATGGKSARGYIESPVLAEQVAAGKLPPIDERLPEEPFVVGSGVFIQPEYQDWEDGKHGGVLHHAAVSGSFYFGLASGTTILRSPGQTSAASLPNVVSAFSHNDDYTNFKFTIRKGLKWSDGVPVTTEDVRFTFEDLYNDPDVQMAWPTELYNLGNSNLGKGEYKITDDFNFELTFAKPYGQLVVHLNSWIPNYQILFTPSHYFKQFHAKYAKKEDLDALLAKNNQNNWVALLKQKNPLHWDHGLPSALGLPVLNAWVLTEVREDQRVFDRNPYFWHVDKSGNQLPYVDKVINNISVDPDAQVNATLAGNVDLACERDAPLNKLPVFKQNADKAGFNIRMTNSFNWPIQLFLNQDYQYDQPDSVWQTLIADPDKKFSKAIGLAINPKDINDSVFFGMFGEPILTTKVHDVEQAKKLLDEAGMTVGSDSFRLGPDGKPFVLAVTYCEFSTEFTPVAELVKQQLEAVGIKVNLDTTGTDSASWSTRAAANELMAAFHWNDGPAWGSGMSEDYLPAHKGPWSPATWVYFTSQGKEGRKPPQYLQDFYDLHTARKAYPPETPEGKKAFENLMNWFEANCVLFPCTGIKTLPNLSNKKLRNVQKEGGLFELDTYLSAEGVWYAE